MTRSNSFRYTRSRTDTRLLYKKLKPKSDEEFNAFTGVIYESLGAKLSAL